MVPIAYIIVKMGKEDDSQSLLETSLETMSMSTDASYISFFEAAEEGTVISDDACRPAYSYGAISSSTPATVESSMELATKCLRFRA